MRTLFVAVGVTRRLDQGEISVGLNVEICKNEGYVAYDGFYVDMGNHGQGNYKGTERIECAISTHIQVKWVRYF